MRAFDEQGQHAGRLAARGETDRFRRGNLRVALADDLSPTADDRALNEAETPECHSPDFADQLAGCAGTTASSTLISTGLLLRHFRMVMP